MRDSIFYSSLRAFAVVLSGTVALCIGLILIIAFVGALSEKTEAEPDIDYTYEPRVVANADFVRKKVSKEAPVILKLDVQGMIGTELLNRQTIQQQLLESRERYFKKGQVKALLLCIDTPGGTVTDADGIYRMVKAYKERYKIPVFAYVDGYCASGGMYVAAAADKVFATESSLIGSIGVLSPSFFNLTQLIDKVGIQALTLTAGKGKDDLNPWRQWKPGEQDALQSLINHYYQMFVDIVVAARPAVNKEKLINEYGAKVFPASVAKEYGFIDEDKASMEIAIRELTKHLGIEDDYYEVIQLESTKWFASLIKGNFGLLKGQIKHKLSLSPELEPEMMNQFLYLHRFDG